MGRNHLSRRELLGGKTGVSSVFGEKTELTPVFPPGLASDV
jgi:hypothetical protein